MREERQRLRFAAETGAGQIGRRRIERRIGEAHRAGAGRGGAVIRESRSP
jgi:hypothetical protein